MSISAMRAVPARDGVRFGFPLPSTPCRARQPQLHRQCILCAQGQAMPETTFTFRVDQELKKAFTEAARARDRPGSQLLRDFMRVYVERAEHDAWFRAEVEQSLKEAGDPNVELIPHEEVVRKWKTRGAEWLKKAKRERGD